MSKFKDKRPRERTTPKGTIPIRGPGPILLVKLQEQWTIPGELWPRVFIGDAHPVSRLMKFLDKSGCNGAQRKLIRKGIAVAVKFGDGIRMLQLVSPDSQSGTFRHGENGLIQLTEQELKT